MFDVGWGIGQWELNSDAPDLPYIDLANGQQHVVTVRRHNRGRNVFIKVDDYPHRDELVPGLDESTDTKLDNPKYIYFGRNSKISVHLFDTVI